MKGVILAGGTGSRLHPLTVITNKHLLPVYDTPMIYFGLKKLVGAGITDILIVTGGNHAGEFLRLLGDGSALGIEKLSYTYQENELGIANALSLARSFAQDEPICVLLGDNLFEDDLGDIASAYGGKGCMIVLCEVPDPQRFGVVELRDGRVVSIVEKPEKPAGRFIQSGIYFFDRKVFGIIDGLKPSVRNEYEIVDVTRRYLEMGELSHTTLRGWWTDAGTFESLYRASTLVRAERLSSSAGEAGER